MSPPTVRLEAHVRGRVQGVAFRWHTRAQARRLGLTGWVRNLPDGSVRLVAEGDRETLVRLGEWLEHGPDHARVDGCDLNWSDAAGKWTDFHID